MSRIAVIVPRKMVFGAAGATPVDLYARDTVRFSRHARDIVVLGGAVAEPFPGIVYRALPQQPGEAHWRWRRRFAEFVAAAEPDLVEVHAHRPTASLLAQRLPGTPVVFFRHNFGRYRRSPLWRWHYRRTVSRFAGVVFVSEALRQDFRRKAPWFAGGLHVVHNTLEMTGEAGPPTAKERVILQVGRLIPEKGALEFAEAMGPVLGAHPDWRAAMIGRGPDAAYVERVRAALAAAGERAALLPFMPHDEVMGWFDRAAIACVPSVYAEPFGRTALEAMAAGAALVCSGTGGLREIVGQDALMLPEVTTASIAAAVERLIGDEALRARLQTQGPGHVRQHFGPSAVVGRLDEIRDGYLARPRGRRG